VQRRDQACKIQLTRVPEAAVVKGVASSRFASARPGPSSNWMPSTQSPGTLRSNFSSAPLRRMCHASTAISPMGRSARRAIFHAVRDLWDARPQQELERHQQIAFMRTIARRGKVAPSSSIVRWPPKMSTAFIERAPTTSVCGQVRLARREDFFGVDTPRMTAAISAALDNNHHVESSSAIARPCASR
jgi:hypothetical protein